MTWEFEADGWWVPFPKDSNVKLLCSYRQYLQSNITSPDPIWSGAEQYTIDFYSMEQTNVRTKRRRSIRLNHNVPDTWRTIWADPHRILVCNDFVVPEACPMTVQHIFNLLKKTAHPASKGYARSMCGVLQRARIVQVDRVENEPLWQRYCEHLFRTRQTFSSRDGELGRLHMCGINQTMMRKHTASLGELDSEVNEMWLFHGTGPGTAHQIAMSGFDNRLSNKGLYGDGTYFASQACKSHQYTCPHGSCRACECRGTRTIILARVVLGDFYVTHQTLKGYRRPPEKGDNLLYDSVLANPGDMLNHPKDYQDHQEFVIFDMNQAYPQYLIRYTLD
eukprot:TRINITY_DN110495_c0_g1_i1.p1 TRINITY_DN110495_c0_g1~~TRINITY_DN110495_c0_g1_i1.p1  ORF type:complete len:387 (-),score=25.74 TRINITY_DN110495_c0_g1_i1:192-1196(-)